MQHNTAHRTHPLLPVSGEFERLLGGSDLLEQGHQVADAGVGGTLPERMYVQVMVRCMCVCTYR